MGIENLIANSIQPSGIMTPFQLQAGQDELNQNKLMNEARRRAMAEQDRQRAQEGLINRLYSENYNNPEGFKRAAAQAGIGSVIPEYENQQREVQKEQRLQEAAGLEKIIKTSEVIASRLRGARPENWEQTVAGIEQEIGKPIPKLHFAYDPQKVDAVIQEGLSNTDAIKLKLDEYRQVFEQEKFGYQKQKDDQQMALQEKTANNQQQWNQANFDQRERSIEATRINKPVSPMQTKIDNAQETDALIKQAMPLIDSSTGSYIGAGVDQFNRAFGESDKGAQALSQLKVLGAAIVAKMPRAPGAQSDAELALAQEQVGKLGDPTVPPPEKKAALNTLYEINARQIERAKQAGLIQQDVHQHPAQPGLGGGASGGWSDSNDPFAGFTPEEKALYLKQYGGR